MTKKNYIQTVKSFNPQRLFTFSSVNSFINYDGRELIGAVFDENTSAMLTPTLTYLKSPPKEINLFGPSVIENEKENQSLAISGASALTPYNVCYDSQSPTTLEHTDSTVSVQFRVPTQILNNVTVINEYTTPKAVITTNKNKTFTKDATLLADQWFLGIEQAELDGAETFTVSMSYKNRVFHNDEYYLETPTKFKSRFKTNPNDIYNLPVEPHKIPEYNLIMPELPNSATTPANFSWGYGLEGNRPIYMLDEINHVENSRNNILYSSGPVMLYGKINERVDIGSYSTVANGNRINKMTDIISINEQLSFRIIFNKNSASLILDNKGVTLDGWDVSNDLTFDIQTDTNYTLVVTHKKSEIDVLQYDTICYLNGKQIYKGGLYANKSFAESDIRIGTKDSIMTTTASASISGFWRSTDLIYSHNSITTFIDNLVVYPSQLSARDIYLMYIRTMTYTQLLLSFKPYAHLIFDKPVPKYNNQFGSDRLEVNNFNTSAVNIDSEVYNAGTRFRGRGSLLHKNQSTNNSDTTSLINFNSSFSIVTWLSTTTRNFLLFSERNKSNYESGLSIFVEDGYITYMYGDTKYRTTCFISDGKFRMLCMSYDGQNIKTFIPQEHSSTKAASLSNSSMYPRYVTLLNDKGISADVDVTLCAFTVFNMALDTQQFTDLYNESIDFSVVGTVMYKNLPAYATVRIIEHSTGKLLDTQYTDGQGMFKYTSIYKNDIDLITLNNGRIQVLGTLQSTTR